MDGWMRCDLRWRCWLRVASAQLKLVGGWLGWVGWRSNCGCGCEWRRNDQTNGELLSKARRRACGGKKTVAACRAGPPARCCCLLSAVNQRARHGAVGIGIRCDTVWRHTPAKSHMFNEGRDAASARRGPRGRGCKASSIHPRSMAMPATDWQSRMDDGQAR